MAIDLAAIRKAKQTYTTTKQPVTSGRNVSPIQAMSANTKLTPTKTATPQQAAQMMVNTTPRTEQTLNNIQSSINKPFEFNADTDQGYQAALRAAQQNLMLNQKNTNAGLRANGQGKSSYSETVANQLAHQSELDVANNVLPQYLQQAYGRYQDNINNQSNLYGLQYQQDVTTPLAESRETGIYQNAAIKAALATINENKQKAEAKGVTAAQRMVYSQEADRARAILDQNGVDSTKYGANVNSKNINFATAGVRTLDGQRQDMAAQAQEYGQGITNAQLTGVMPDGTKTTAEQQRELTNMWTAADQTGTIPPELAKLYNLPEGTQTLAAKQFAQQLAISQQNADISQQNADTSRFSANTSRDNAAWNQQTAIIDAQNRAQQDAAKTMTPQDYAKSYVNPIAKRDKNGSVTNKNDVISAISMGSESYSDSQLDQMFSQYGITDADIKAYQKAYSLGE